MGTVVGPLMGGGKRNCPTSHHLLTYQRVRTKLTLRLEMDLLDQPSYNWSWTHGHNIFLEN